MTNYLRLWREGAELEEDRAEKLKRSVKHLSNEKEKTVNRKRIRHDKYVLDDREARIPMR